MTLAQCPGSDTTICLRPGAGVTCPAEMVLTTTSSIVSTSTPQAAQPPTTESTLLTTQAEAITDGMTSTKSTTPFSITSSATTPRETTENLQLKMSRFFPAVLLIIIYNF